MDTQTPNVQTPVSEPTPEMMTMETPKKSPLGPVIGLVIILAVIIVGSLYFWGQKVEQDAAIKNAPTQTEQRVVETAPVDSQVEALQTQSSSDDINSIEADLNATDFTNIDGGIENIN